MRTTRLDVLPSDEVPMRAEPVRISTELECSERDAKSRAQGMLNVLDYTHGIGTHRVRINPPLGHTTLITSDSVKPETTAQRIHDRDEHDKRYENPLLR